VRAGRHAKTPAGAFAEYAVRRDRRQRTRSSLVFFRIGIACL
jgi:hypothetical protein